ncbi:guanylate kinase [Candidatus Kaiserbacteria bacterium CG10_big_fil_rev_8_21_14_0_10_59_10]|uniref:Guanylate kinase n=1 Tax=Candidatus Kaiserbacteria bacterium CG10_big_fil_rev_8_21_14_0_10_59_10 TaxID=1974612 RepID=A0A2H0U8S5_9BACT|nr:MAG: guanylate kinase [Candidatus Kaiserbacteria bacterium CG10_big_fil_rev_8_21_14_0_10_59_10]
MSAGMPKQIANIAGPSGGGKNSIIDALRERFSNCTMLVTATTRAPRPGEQDGRDKFFFTNERFNEERAAGNIVEHRYVPALGTHYGVYKPDLEKRLASGRVILADVDIVGARFLKEHYNATTIFILPESIESLRTRVRLRNPNMSDAELEERMRIAEKEIAEYAPQYDYRVVNADGKLARAVDEVVEILQKEGYTLVR